MAASFGEELSMGKFHTPQVETGEQQKPSGYSNP